MNAPGRDKTSWFALLAFGLYFTSQSIQALELEQCRLERDGLPAAFAECGRFAVPEDPNQPGSPPLELFVARVAALTATPAADPLVLINGGPGGSSVDLFLQSRSAFAPTSRDREIILIDQRGTGRSLAGLACDTPDDLQLETASPEMLREAVQACIAAFPRDPALFTTSIAVRDLEALRVELGIAQWNIYGVSYGTRVAQHYLRRYPDSVRSVILDGVVPAELVLGPDIARDAQSALDALIDRCAANGPCAERFGDLEEKFAVLRERFAGDTIELTINDPRTGQPKHFDLGEVHLQSVVRLMSYADTTAALLPLVIDEAYVGNYEPLASQADLLIESVSESIGFAMHNSVVCTEDVPFFPATAGSNPIEPYLGTDIVDALSTICEVWPQGLRDEDFSEPVASNKPVLLLSGENDPVTPPGYAERVIAGGLVNSVHVIGRGKGHGLAAVGCVPKLIRDFLATPVPSELAVECLEPELPMPFFLNFQGPAP
jgi:pimeloyl-ACP methyl ester carboxylesterase